MLNVRGPVYEHFLECPHVDGSWCDRIVIRHAPIIPGVFLFGPCWCWTGWNNAKPGGAYGKVWNKGRADYLHRVMWERHNGMLLSGGEVIDHLCRVRLCFSPHHLECVDHQENAQRRHDYAAKFKMSEFDPELEAQIKDLVF